MRVRHPQSFSNSFFFTVLLLNSYFPLIWPRNCIARLLTLPRLLFFFYFFSPLCVSIFISSPNKPVLWAKWRNARVSLLTPALFTLINSVFISALLFSFLSFTFFTVSSRFSILYSSTTKAISSVTTSLAAKVILSYLLFVFLLINLFGNIPLNVIPTMFYSLTLTVRMLFWVPLMICVCYTDFQGFLSHMLPYGSPVGLILFLPLIEIFSQIIRPFTLMIRLRTNLSSGHIIIYMFSYFTLLSSALSPFIYVVLILLFILELCISALQA